MTADQLKTLTTDALDRLATLLDEGHSERLIAMLKTMGRFHRYSFHDLCLITAQCPTATGVAGFQTWRTMGRFVRKGEKGIAILAPIVGRRNTDTVDDHSKPVLGFRAVAGGVPGACPRMALRLRRRRSRMLKADFRCDPSLLVKTH